MKRDEVARVISPLSSNTIWNWWALIITRDGAAGWRYTSSESLRWAFLSRLGVGRDPADQLLETDPARFAASLASHVVRDYRRNVLTRVAVQIRMRANQIVFELADGRVDRYSIMNRSQTAECRESLRAAFPGVYEDVGVATTWVGKMLRW